ncbi:MAG: hypothetical protein IPP15_11575 [Saprospiraceae bacterium]|uniref:Uncharacterized protein n=1 Tax=Candidatus Opimibacter skivensis TaxID=2982028 RepID=A0A9D7STW8_9BACT|nr:hypothetical protein [Candidatus Opimibacter skivensis]
MKRNFYSLSLLTLFIANTIGGISILCLHHFRINEYVESIIHNGNYHIPLDEVVIAPHDADKLIWLKDNLEFNYQGHMYDIVCTDVKNDTMIYHCINDKTEEGLIHEIANNDNHPFPGQHQDSRIVLQFFKIISEIVIAPSANSIKVADENLRSFFSYNTIFYPVYLSLSCEPPDIA